MFQLAEIFFAQAIERRAIEFGCAAHPVVLARLEGLAFLVVPRFFGNVAILNEHLAGIPIFLLAWQPVPRSRIKILLPDGANWRANVPPPAPLPMIITS